MTAHLPLFSAIRSGDLSATSIHLSTLSPTSPWPRDLDGHTPLHWAAMSDTISMLPLVLQYVNNNRPVDVHAIATPQRDQTPLHWACVGGRLQSVLALLDTGADLNIVDAKGFTPVVHAVHYGRVDVVHVLVKRGGGRVVRVVDYEGHGVLEWAAYYGHMGVVVYLLNVCGVDVNTEYQYGMTALHQAAMLAHLAVVDVLLRAGADVSKRNREGKSAEEVAAEGRVKGLLHMWAVGVMSREKPVGKRVTLRKYRFVLFYYVLLVASYLKLWEVVTEKREMSVVAGFALHVGIVISLVSHVRATFGDPGDLEVGNEDKFVKYIEKVIQNGTSESALGPSTFCYVCLSPRPPRSKHSRERDRCVRLFDHECPWVNNTVGLHTRKTSLLLVTSTAISQWLYIYIIMRPLMDGASFFKLGEVFAARPLVCLLVVLNSLVSAFCAMLLLTHIRLVLKGQTTFEYLMAQKEARIANPYDMGVWKNIISFLTSTNPDAEHVIPRLSPHSLREVVMSTGELQAPVTADHIDDENKRLAIADHNAMNKVSTR